MTNTATAKKLTKAQREVLATIATCGPIVSYGRKMKPLGALHAAGLVERVTITTGLDRGCGGYGLTEAGRAAL